MMKALILAMVVACASAQWWPYSSYGYSAIPLATPKSQYHYQNELGQASYGYAYPGQAAHNVRDAAGNQVGSYAYINPEGKHVQVAYTADHNGFRVMSNDLPVAPLGRKKRQVLSAIPYGAIEHPNYVADFVSSSTDLNRDGQPDNKQVVPVAYSAPIVSAPLATSYVSAPLAYSGLSYGHSLASPYVLSQPALLGRKKRQVLSAIPYGALEHPNYAEDFVSSSTDLNRDGQPDNKQVVPVVAAAYSAPIVSAPLATSYVASAPLAYSGLRYGYSGLPYGWY